MICRRRGFEGQPSAGVLRCAASEASPALGCREVPAFSGGSSGPVEGVKAPQDRLTLQAGGFSPEDDPRPARGKAGTAEADGVSPHVFEGEDEHGVGSDAQPALRRK